MKKIVSTLAFFMILVVTAQDSKRVFGKVSDGNSPLANVNVSVFDTGNTTLTDNDGAYEIYVEEGDKVQFASPGMKTITIKIEDVTRVLNPIMVSNITELDEVVVKASKRRSQEELEEDYPINENIIKTAWGYLDTQRAPGQAWLMNEDDINPVRLCILELLQSRFPGVQVTGNCTAGGSVKSSRYRSLTKDGSFIFDVDGQLFSDPPVWIPVLAMKRIAIFPGLAMAARYGSLGGGGGVIVINTVNGSPQIDKTVDRARLRNNFLTEKALTEQEVLRNMPEYEKELESALTYATAKEIFESNKAKYANSPYFFLDTYRHFSKKWNNQDHANAILDKNFALFRDNAVLLKALAYSYEEHGAFKRANEMYKEAFIQRPNYAQSYLDMANSYRNVQQYKQSAAMYSRYRYLQDEGFMKADTIGFDPIINREFNNLLVLKKEVLVEEEKSKKFYVAGEDFQGTRIVFEWNDGEAEFELQFVTPGNQYTTWKHSLADNDGAIEREKEFGYNVKEYLFDYALLGSWSVNVNYLGNKSLTPTYLKTTVYYNYGTYAQRKEVKVFKLSLKNVPHELFTFSIGGKLASNK